MPLAAGAALALAAGAAGAQTPKRGGIAQLRRRRRAAELRLPRQHHVRAHPPDRAALLAAGEVRRQGLPEGHPGPGAELDGRARRHDLHLQAAQRGQVPRRLGAHLRGRQGELRAHHQPADGRGVDPQGLLLRSRRRGARPDDRGVQAEEPDGGRAGGAGLALQLHLQRRQAQAEPALSRDRDHGLGRLHAGRARAGHELGGQALRGLLRQGQALSRRLQGLLRQVERGRSRHHRRPVRRRVPRPQPVGEGPAAGQDEGQPRRCSRAPGSTT